METDSFRETEKKCKFSEHVGQIENRLWRVGLEILLETQMLYNVSS